MYQKLHCQGTNNTAFFFFFTAFNKAHLVILRVAALEQNDNSIKLLKTVPLKTSPAAAYFF